MDKFIFCGCDLHDKNMLCKIAVDKGAPIVRSFQNDAAGRAALIADLFVRSVASQGARIVFGYEASGLGFGLYDETTVAGITCHVLAPSKMKRSPKQRQAKTDEKDADAIIEMLRGHYLAGNALADVWIPDAVLRDDRMLVRCRLDAQEKVSSTKTQIVTLLKCVGKPKPAEMGGNWTKEHRAWLAKLAGKDGALMIGARTNLDSLLRQLSTLEKEVMRLDVMLEKLSKTERYAGLMKKVTALPAVGTLTALVFLTEMGDLNRFNNRRQVGSYLGLVPSSDETGETKDRKGHITHQGPARVRFVLNQAVWNILRCDPEEREVYERIAKKNPKHKKIAVVAAMRRLAVRMWHAGRSAAA